MLLISLPTAAIQSLDPVHHTYRVCACSILTRDQSGSSVTKLIAHNIMQAQAAWWGRLNVPMHGERPPRFGQYTLIETLQPITAIETLKGKHYS